MNAASPTICLIAAIADNGVIGREDKLPWRIPSELRSFKNITLGKPVIFGRKTFESFGGKPLPGRPNIVVTRDPQWACADTHVTRSLAEALKIAGQRALESTATEIFVCGGGEIYRQALPLAQRFYLTRIHLKPAGDMLFPDFNPDEWIEIKREFHPAAPGEEADYTLTVLERKLP